MASEDRIIAIETKLAYHEDLVQSLNDTIIMQQKQLEALTVEFRNLRERMTSIGGATHPDADERPPHY